jgi:hypothetical protein
MSEPIYQLSGEEAVDKLTSHLTEAERDKVFDIYKDISAEIRWGRVLAEMFPNLLDAVQDVIFGLNDFKSNRYVKRNPWEAIQADTSLFEDGDEKAMSRRHLLLLYLTKKLLGVAKTKVNLEVADIPVLGPQEESDLLDIVQAAEEREEEQVMARAELDADHEVTAELERERVIDLSPDGDCRQNGRHVRTEVRYRRKNDESFSEQYCKDCRQVVKKTVFKGSGAPVKVENCEHPGAEWVEGKEGKEAICTKCQGPIPNPETYQWATAGLEPYGDDPTKDEAITLCSAY